MIQYRLVATKVWLLVPLLATAACSFQDETGGSRGRAKDVFDGVTLALAEAAERGDVRELERLVTRGADINAPGKRGLTPLWWAVRTKNMRGSDWLLARGANQNIKVEQQALTIMQLAASYRNSEFLELLLRHQPKLEGPAAMASASAVNAAISARSRRNLELLIRAGANLNGNADEMPAMECACALAKYDFVLLMLESGADFSRIWDVGASAGQNRLVSAIRTRHIDPDSEAYIWRERVMRFLKARAIQTTYPPKEPPRTKPLPADLR